MSASGSSRRRGHRRVVAPGTSGQPEEQEAQGWEVFSADPGEDQDTEADDAATREKWLKAERPPHWG
ncbi:hypothetical protein [Nesterenkonia alba]|uniref:hypothetical protein n=1 Tax=Nesterenkonia alba TaxID=515814 RepID=UPI0003B40DA7|nr:hypothetical protein [Nesterenkonia alba]